jgi:uncharacterized protein YlbG (UPF0298 family)
MSSSPWFNLGIYLQVLHILHRSIIPGKSLVLLIKDSQDGTFLLHTKQCKQLHTNINIFYSSKKTLKFSSTFHIPSVIGSITEEIFVMHFLNQLHCTHFHQELKNVDPKTNTKRHKFIDPTIMHKQQQMK